mmetsp:Transcript_112405/g.194972  ORF Transcript_112405/g.194972 Transcript_112405/m.194972 type:complete len:183 (+) Transcript_112405:54-602(+)
MATEHQKELAKADGGQAKRAKVIACMFKPLQDGNVSIGCINMAGEILAEIESEPGKDVEWLRCALAEIHPVPDDACYVLMNQDGTKMRSEQLLSDFDGYEGTLQEAIEQLRVTLGMRLGGTSPRASARDPNPFSASAYLPDFYQDVIKQSQRLASSCRRTASQGQESLPRIASMEFFEQYGL